MTEPPERPPSGDEPEPPETPDPAEGTPLHAAPPSPEPPSALSQARDARAVADEVESRAFRALWLGALRWPLRHGTLLGVVLLLAVALGLSLLEGGADRDARRLRMVGRVVVGFAGFAVLGLYARRVLFNTLERDRRVPWLLDREDDVVWWRAITDFAVVVAFALLPMGIVTLADALFDLPGWVSTFCVPALFVLGVAQLPLALVAVTARGSPTAAMPHMVLRVWRAAPRASRAATLSSVAFVALLLSSFWLAAGLYPDDPAQLVRDDTGARLVARLGLAALRFGAFYAALVSFRVAGVLVRDVPEVREVLE